MNKKDLTRMSRGMKTFAKLDDGDRCYFCDAKAELSLLVTPCPRRYSRCVAFAGSWFQSFCVTHWNQIMSTGPLNLTKPVERKDLLSQERITRENVSRAKISNRRN